LPKKFFDSAQKNCYANLQNYFSDSPHPVIISKNPGFRALYLTGQNKFRFLFNKYKKIYFSFLAAGSCPKSLSFAQKIMVLLQPPGSYAYGYSIIYMTTNTKNSTETNENYITAIGRQTDKLLWQCH